jgi:hypothetical protein
MGAQGEVLAGKVELAADQLISAIEGCPDGLWTATTAAEGWSVAATSHHAADGFDTTSQFVMAVAKGLPVPALTRDMIDGGNAKHAQEFAACSKSETIELARTASAKAAATLRGLSDEELARTVAMPLLGEQPLTATQLAEYLVIGHPIGHVESVHATA